MLCLLLGGLAYSCDPFLEADPARRREILREELQLGNSPLVDTIADHPERIAGLMEAHQGAPWLIARRLKEAGATAQAVTLLERQIGGDDPVYAALAFADLLDMCKTAPPARKSLGSRGEGFLARLDPAGSRFTALRDQYRQTVLGIWMDSGQAAMASRKAREWMDGVAVPAPGAPPRDRGDPGIPSWLLWYRAAAGTGNAGEREAFAAYFLAWDARSGHRELLSLRPDLLPRGEGLAALAVEAKRALQAGRTVQALDVLDTLAGMQDALRAWMADPLGSRCGLDGVVKDAYTAARQAGKTERGIAVLERFAHSFHVVSPALEAYARELAGRLLLQDEKYAPARDAFETSLGLAMAPADRDRVAWYLVRSWLDEAGTGRRIAPGALARALVTAGPGDYLSDVRDEAWALLARMGEWEVLAGLYRDNPGLGSPVERCRPAWTLVLERPSSAEGKAALAWLQEQSASVYYRALARARSGLPVEPLVVSGAAPSAGPEASGDPAGPASPASGARAEAVRGARVFDDLEAWGAAAEFAWDWRVDLDDAFLCRVVSALHEGGHHRQAQRLADSMRLRKGHPEDRATLECLYPVLMEDWMDDSLQGLRIPPSLWYGLVRTESAFDTGASSRVGAVGLSQLMPDTAREIMARHGMDANLEDPRVNLRVGALYLQEQFDRFGSWPAALAAYNAGPGRMRAWQKETWSRDPAGLAERIPYRETRDYVRRVLETAMIHHWLHGDGSDPGTFTTLLTGNPRY